MDDMAGPLLVLEVAGTPSAVSRACFVWACGSIGPWVRSDGAELRVVSSRLGDPLREQDCKHPRRQDHHRRKSIVDRDEKSVQVADPQRAH